MHRRPAHKQHGGLWEFPGGKIEVSENPREALARELAEELGIAIDPAAIEPVVFAESAGDGAHLPIVLLLYIVRAWRGCPAALEGGSCGWFPPAEVGELAMPPLDRDLHRLLMRLLPG